MFDPDYSLVPALNADIMDILDLETKLTNLTSQDVDVLVNEIANSKFMSGNPELMAAFVEQSLAAINVRYKNIDNLVKLLGELVCNGEINPKRIMLKNALLDEIFRPIGDWRFVLKIPLFLLLRKFYVKRYISLFDILERIEYMVQYQSRSPNVICAILSIFAGEIDRFDVKLFNKLIKFMENHEYGSFFDIFLKKHVNKFEDFRTSGWHDLINLVEGNTDENKIINAISHDNLDFIVNLFAEKSTNPNKSLIDQTFEPCLYLQGGITLIQCAAFFGALNIFKFLYLNKASLQLKDRRKRGVLDFAIAGGDLEILRIMEHANVKFTPDSIKVAVQFRRKEIFDWILQSKSDIFDNVQQPLDSSLCLCCRIGYLGGCIQCIAYGANPSAIVDGKTPFMDASMNGYLAIMKFLSSLNISNIASHSKDGKNALHFAARSGKEEAVKLLVNSGMIDINSKSGDGATALHIAAKFGHNNIAEFLLSKKGIDVNVTDHVGATPLHYASLYSQSEIVKTLLMCPRLNVKMTTSDGKTAFDLARNQKIRAMLSEALLHMETD